MTKKPTFVLSILLIAMAGLPVLAQEDEATRFYQAGDYKKAAKLFKSAVKKDKNNAKLWNLYGLALERDSKTKDAGKAFKKAAELEPSNFDYISNLTYVYLTLHDWDKAEDSASNAIRLQPENARAYYYRGAARLGRDKLEEALGDSEKAITLASGESSFYVLKSEILIKRFGNDNSSNKLPDELDFLKASIDELEVCINACSGDLTEIENRLENQRVLYSYFDRKRNDDQSASVDTSKAEQCEPLEILSKPIPVYTAQASREGVTGSIRVLVLFGSDGEIGQIMILRGLPAGLNDEAIRVARAIRFKPKVCNGNPKASVKLIEYSFSIY